MKILNILELTSHGDRRTLKKFLKNRAIPVRVCIHVRVRIHVRVSLQIIGNKVQNKNQVKKSCKMFVSIPVHVRKYLFLNRSMVRSPYLKLILNFVIFDRISSKWPISPLRPISPNVLTILDSICLNNGCKYPQNNFSELIYNSNAYCEILRFKNLNEKRLCLCTCLTSGKTFVLTKSVFRVCVRSPYFVKIWWNVPKLRGYFSGFLWLYGYPF